jgi:hypothetical protein
MKRRLDRQYGNNKEEDSIVDLMSEINEKFKIDHQIKKSYLVAKEEKHV